MVSKAMATIVEHSPIVSARWETLGAATPVSSCAVCRVAISPVHHLWPNSRSIRAALSRLADVSQQPSPGAETIVDERTQERPDYKVEEGDHERFSHYVPKDKLTEAMVMGTPVVALCGKVWVPSRDPERFPVCPECKEIWESLKPGSDEN